jgi:hypothetical protein
LKRYILNQSPKGLGATGYGGLKPFVDDLKHRLHLHRIVKGFGEKLWGYKLGGLVLVLLCRPQLGANSIAALREKLLAIFITRLSTSHFSAFPEFSGFHMDLGTWIWELGSLIGVPGTDTVIASS